MRRHVSAGERRLRLDSMYRAAEAEQKRKEQDEINRIVMEILYGKKNKEGGCGDN